ncbi:hypothetical protein EPUS_07513 [Endocarpon pusillum Z07020]|uniref:Uncharacterized protein n=1 Tax=Endocarpon pusillum (strain Z07020 / HMAS-L-300199) TaxID=1263415 RepID=U1HW19_ENDPU|nr:uncharacterized protein EPUS_07513 [Endocarpon pusillum Z07020]ERF73579.1 hypothetical protein EPUS_07513 [Endocarpon pusillum Z07020]
MAHSVSDNVSLQPLTSRTSFSATCEGNKRTYSSSSPDVVSSQPVGQPCRLAHSKFWRNPLSFGTIVFIGDVLLTLCPCLFLVLAFRALAVDNQPLTSPQGQLVERAAEFGPTLYPIIFAAVCGRLMRTYALWRAEKGEELGILEQLNGSQNLLAAFERAILIPGLGLLSTGIVLLWLLSPIGGQSSLRVLSKGTSTTTGEATLYYFNNTSEEGSVAFQGASAYEDYKGGVSAVFQAALTSLERVKGSDIWGNVKIPVLQYMAHHQHADDGWLEFDEDNYKEPYSALTGLVISGLKDDTDSRFTIESSYFNLTCTGPILFNNSISMEFSGFTEYGAPFIYRENNASLLFQPIPGYANHDIANTYMIDTNYNHSQRTDSETRYNYIYASTNAIIGEYTRAIAAYNCTVGVTYVENDLQCVGRSCRVQRLRPSRRAVPNYSGWPWPVQSVAEDQLLLDWMNTATSIHGGSARTSAIDFYISGSKNPFDNMQPISYHNITGEQMGRRLQSLVNTGWQLSYQGSATVRAPSENLTALDVSIPPFGINSTYYRDGVGYPVATTTAITTSTTGIYVAGRAWVSVTIIVSFVLLFCSIAGMVFKYVYHSPDILGFVSSMTRDNPNFEQIPGSDKMDGLQRARAMKHVRVQIVDVAPWDGGYIVLRSVGRRTATKTP